MKGAMLGPLAGLGSIRMEGASAAAGQHGGMRRPAAAAACVAHAALAAGVPRSPDTFLLQCWALSPT